KREHLPGDDEILLNVEGAEHHGLLEGPQHAAFASDVIQRPARDILTIELHGSRVWLRKTRHTVKERGFSRPIGADQPANLSTIDMEADAVDCADGAVRFAQARDFEDRQTSHLRLSRNNQNRLMSGANPLGNQKTNPSRHSPYAIMRNSGATRRA